MKYPHYNIISLKTTKVFNLTEIVELGLRIVDSEDYDEIDSFTSFVKPSIAKDLSIITQINDGIHFEDLEHDFATVLSTMIESNRESFENGLVVMVDQEKMFSGQYLIEQALGKDNLTKDMKFFKQWCDLLDIFDYIEPHKLADFKGNNTVQKLISFYWKDEPYLLKKAAKSCLDQCEMIAHLMHTMHYSLRNWDFFPTSTRAWTTDQVPACEIDTYSCNFPFESPLYPILEQEEVSSDDDFDSSDLYV